MSLLFVFNVSITYLHTNPPYFPSPITPHETKRKGEEEEENDQGDGVGGTKQANNKGRNEPLNHPVVSSNFLLI